MTRSAASPRRAAGVNSTAIWVLCLVQFVDVLGVTEMVTALPSVLTGLRASGGSASIVLTAYPACFAGVLMLGARLADRYGAQRVLLCGLAAFFGASLLAAVAPSVAVLVVGRAGQGVAAAISVPATLRLLNAIARDDRERDRAFAAWSANGAVAGAGGFLIGGGLTQAVGWRWMFWVDLPAVALLAAGVAAMRVPLAADPARRLDLAGAGALTLAILAAVVAVASVQPPTDAAVAIAAAAVALGSALVLLAAERRASQPLLAAGLRRDPRLRAGARASLLNTATTSSAFALATLHLQDAQHLGAARAGLQLLPVSVGAIVGARAAPRLLVRRSRPAVIGLGLATIAVADLALVLATGSPAAISVAVGVAGVGLGGSSVAATALAVDVPARDQATAGAAANTAAQLGTAIGVAVLLLLAGTLTHGDPRVGWGLAAAVAALGALFSRAVPPRSPPRWPRRSPTRRRRGTVPGMAPDASQEIDAKIAGLGDWRGETLARLRGLIRQAEPAVVEEIKWRKPSNPGGVAAWSHAGLICTGEIYRQAIKLTFAKGASVPDPAGLFNSSLGGNTRRAIDFHERDELDEQALVELVRAAAHLNAA